MSRPSNTNNINFVKIKNITLPWICSCMSVFLHRIVHIELITCAVLSSNLLSVSRRKRGAGKTQRVKKNEKSNKPELR